MMKNFESSDWKKAVVERALKCKTLCFNFGQFRVDYTNGYHNDIEIALRGISISSEPVLYQVPIDVGTFPFPFPRVILMIMMLIMTL